MAETVNRHDGSEASAQDSRTWSLSTATTANTIEVDLTIPIPPLPPMKTRSLPSSQNPARATRLFPEIHPIPQRQLRMVTSQDGLNDVSEMGNITLRSTSLTLPSSETSPTSTQRTRSIKRAPPRLTIQIPASKGNVSSVSSWELDLQNPRNWTMAAKYLHTLVYSALAFIFAFGTSVMAPASADFMADMEVSSLVAVLPVSLYVLGFSFGPLLGQIGSDIYGRKTVYMLCVPLYAIFTLASGLVRITPGVLLCRLCAGLSCSPAFYMGWAMIADIWTAEHKLRAWTIYSSLAGLGSTLGPVIGDVIIWQKDWRWTQYVVLFALGGCLVPVVIMRETSVKAILRKNRGEPARAPFCKKEVLATISKPFKMLLSEPIVVLFGFCTSFTIGVLYAVYTVFPPLFTSSDHFHHGTAGLPFLGMSFGVLFAVMISLAHETFIYRPYLKKYIHSRSGAPNLASGADDGGVLEKANTLTHAEPLDEQNHTHPTRDVIDRRRSSFLSVLRRPSLGTPASGSLEAIDHDSQKNIGPAVAVARHLNSIEANRNKRIMPERVLLLLNQNRDFPSFCAALEAHGLRLDRVSLARVLLDTSRQQQHLASRPLEMTHLPELRATASAILGPLSLPLSLSLAGPCNPERPLQLPSPPPEWHLWLAIPSSFLLPASLLLLAWTFPSPPPSPTAAAAAEFTSTWLAPSIALCLFALSTTTVLCSTTLYVLHVYDSATDAYAALAAAALLAAPAGAAFPLLAQPLYRTLLPGPATSIFACGAVVFGLVPGVLYRFGPRMRSSRSSATSTMREQSL